MNVTLLFGFLGSGKTTLVRRLIDRCNGRVAVIVNEFGDVGIDGEVLRGKNVDMVELNSGCVCCTMKGSLVLAIRELHEKKGVTQVTVESTGIAQPAEVLAAFRGLSSAEFIESCTAVSIVDAGKFLKLERILGDFYLAQVRYADVVILNKVDIAVEQELDEVRRKTREVNPIAPVLLAEHCDVELGSLLGGNMGGGLDRDKALGESHYGTRDAHLAVESFVVDADGDHERCKVESFFGSLPDTVWRAKGFVGTNGGTLLVQYSMGQLEMTVADSRAIKKIVFIGRDMDQVKIHTAFAELSRVH